MPKQRKTKKILLINNWQLITKNKKIGALILN